LSRGNHRWPSRRHYLWLSTLFSIFLVFNGLENCEVVLRVVICDFISKILGFFRKGQKNPRLTRRPPSRLSSRKSGRTRGRLTGGAARWPVTGPLGRICGRSLRRLGRGRYGRSQKRLSRRMVGWLSRWQLTRYVRRLYRGFSKRALDRLARRSGRRIRTRRLLTRCSRRHRCWRHRGLQGGL
jgi:hypothetical protein